MGAPTFNNEASAAVRERLGGLVELAPLLPAIQAAAESHPGVYLVGGAVRDLLLGAASVDLDIAVEGDAIEFARELAGVLGGQVREHERFQTAVVEIGGVGLDVATTRTETYAAPGALPDVSVAGLGEDLARRDFTINAMAASLKAGDFGATCDPTGGFMDLRAGCVKVLHTGSFEDDPTRMLRALRYAARLGFELELGTRGLIEAAVAGGGLAALDSARVRDELVDLLSEASYVEALELMEQTGVDRALHPRLSADRRARVLAGETETIEARLAALCLTMTEVEICAWLDRLSFGARERDAVAAAAARGPALGRELSAERQWAPSELHALLTGRGSAELEIASAESQRAGEMIDRYRERIAGVKLAITGDDLIAAGAVEGPQLGKALRDVLALKLDGFVSGRDEELAAALRALA